jgi:hypothetical protein
MCRALPAKEAEQQPVRTHDRPQAGHDFVNGTITINPSTKTAVWRVHNEAGLTA